MTAKEAVEEVFTKPVSDLIWTANTLIVLPLTPQNFAVGSVLPAVFYMCRRGYRRGRGRFQETFAPGQDARASIWSIAGKLTQDESTFAGFQSETEKDILGDLLLCDALENKGHVEGQTEEILRAFPVHFFASWLDLPPSVGHLRFVPEMLVGLLANQQSEKTIQPGLDHGPFPVGVTPQENLLFRIFGRGVVFGENPADLRGDNIDESISLSLEELVMIRLAQTCGESPERLPVAPGIQNVWPVARRASDVLREDLTTLLQAYGDLIPRRSITPMLECLIGQGLLSIYLECLSITVAWEHNGELPKYSDQKPVPIFVDASNGGEPRLRDFSEQSFEESLRLLDHATISMAQIRVLDAIVRDDPDVHSSRPQGPDNSSWLALLADVRSRRHNVSEITLHDLKRKIVRLSEKLTNAGMEPNAVAILGAPNATQDPVRTIAEAICSMMGDKLLRQNPLKFLDSCLMVNDAHGLGRKRRVSRVVAGRKRKMVDVRSAVLTNTLLESLVHIHLAKHEGVLSFAEFLRILRERYGIWVDQSPPDVSASREDLLNNRAMLERRLRDLGLLVGVNDADFMKHLRPRFQRNHQA